MESLKDIGLIGKRLDLFCGRGREKDDILEG